MTFENFVSIFLTLPHLKNPQNKYERWSAGLCWFFIITEGIFLLFFLLFFSPCCKPVSRFDKYKNRVGSIYKNIDYTKGWSRLVPVIFVLKRILFVVGVWFIKLKLLILMDVMTMLTLVYLLSARPYLEDSQLKIEVFNETIQLIFFISL
jgi:hypothetical protein